MQPLISPVDHESRHNSYRAEDEQQQPTEDSPLLHRFPRPTPAERWDHVNTAVVSLLLIILISGIIIGIYLLVIQSNSENVLPPVPVDTALRLVGRKEWDSNGKSPPMLALSPLTATHVVVVQTDSEQCHDPQACALLLRDLQANTTDSVLPYNFLISSNGQTFEALGWRRPSPLFPEYSALVLAFIGNFTTTPPTDKQTNQAKMLIAESVNLRHLDASYVIIGLPTKYVPKYLFNSLQSLPHWESKVSDVQGSL